LVIMQGPSGAPRVELSAGARGTFGVCACDRCALDIRIAVTGPPQFRGEITVADTTWCVTNLSESECLFVADVARPTEPSVVRPGEGIPFGAVTAVVTPPRAADGTAVIVFASAEPASAPVGQDCPRIGSGRQPRLDPNARYSAVLAMLCESQLEDARQVPLPTSADIAARLGLSPRAVDAHIDYLVAKFDLPVPVTRSTGWKRGALIAHVRGRPAMRELLRRTAAV
jgi:hypothetical protein